ncbi:MAG: YncE family protein [Myxococcales bacterium]|nr:YncE family protein [Polyangiaceae bacterium]MDW8249118.1 YncE family protein [Myxococcales bacterium]
MKRFFFTLTRYLLLGAACSSPRDPKIIDLPAEGAPFPMAPRAFPWPAGPFALVSNYGSDTVSVVDLTQRKVAGTLRAGLDPVDVDGPHHLAYHRQRREIFVALAYPAPAVAPGPHAAHGSSQRPGKVIRLDATTGQISGEMRADSNPGDLALSDDGTRLVVTHFDLQRALTNVTQGVEAQRASLLLYDPNDFRPDASPRSFPVCITPHGVALSRPDGRRAFVACYGEDALAVVDLQAQGEEDAILRIPVGPAAGTGSSLQYGPYTAVLDPTGKQVLIGTTEGRDLRIFDVEAGAMAPRRYSAGGAVYFAAADSGGLVAYVPVQTPDFLARVALDGQGELTELARRTFLQEECYRPHEAALWDNDRELLLVCEGNHIHPGTLLILDPETLETRASLPMEVYPDKVLVVTP